MLLGVPDLLRASYDLSATSIGNACKSLRLYGFIPCFSDKLVLECRHLAADAGCCALVQLWTWIEQIYQKWFALAESQYHKCHADPKNDVHTKTKTTQVANRLLPADVRLPTVCTLCIHFA